MIALLGHLKRCPYPSCKSADISLVRDHYQLWPPGRYIDLLGLPCHPGRGMVKGGPGVVPLLPQTGVAPLPGSSPTGGLGMEDTWGHLPLVGTSLMDHFYLHLQARRVEESHQMVLGELLSPQCPPQSQTPQRLPFALAG